LITRVSRSIAYVIIVHITIFRQIIFRTRNWTVKTLALFRPAFTFHVYNNNNNIVKEQSGNYLIIFGKSNCNYLNGYIIYTSVAISQYITAASERKNKSVIIVRADNIIFKFVFPLDTSREICIIIVTMIILYYGLHGLRP